MGRSLEGAPSKSIYSLLGATFSREMKKGTPSKSMYSLLGVPFSKITIHIRFIETYIGQGQKIKRSWNLWRMSKQIILM